MNKSCAILFVVLVSARQLTAAVDGDEEFFESHVRPLLVARCYECHQRRAEGGLRLDSRSAIVAGGDHGPAVVPGRPAESLLWQAVAGKHDEISMPPEVPLTKEETRAIKTWISNGAVWPASAVPDHDQPDHHGISSKEREFWSFQVPVKPKLPHSSGSRKINPIDAFVEARRQAAQLQSGPQLTPRQFIRRVTYDLTGLPALPAEIDSFVTESQIDVHKARLELIERLLKSPQYGERWAQHWLDLVRYADTAGDAADFPVPEAYKYRNYVIDSFNADIPFDDFAREQLAGDLMPSDSEQQAWRRRIATGYIAISRRIGVSPHGLRHITIEDTINNFGKTFLGLSIGCARCHDHKFDPIPTADYYALYGIFDSTVYPHAGAEHKPYREDFVYRVGIDRAQAAMARFNAKLTPLRTKERAAFERYRDFQRMPISIPGYDRDAAWEDVLQLREQIRELVETFPQLETAYAASEQGGHDAYIHQQGNPREKGPDVRRGFLQILGGQTLPADARHSGRQELADWVTAGDNPLTARVIVNRIWLHHFGRGIVTTPSDFGIRGSRPSHPQLLDFLAVWFQENDWSIKALHRLICSSNTYGLSSDSDEASESTDPDNMWLWRGNRRRLDAEQIRDSILMFTGQLDPEPGGPHPFPHRMTYFFRQHEPFVGEFTSHRRTIYQFRQRIRKNDFLDLFDGPDGNLHVDFRRPTTTSLQSLYFLNSDFIAKQSDAIARRAVRESTNHDDSVITWLYSHVFGRLPAAGETQNIQRYIEQLHDDTDGRTHWASLVRTMLCSNEFLYID